MTPKTRQTKSLADVAAFVNECHDARFPDSRRPFAKREQAAERDGKSAREAVNNAAPRAQKI
jgi:hypothetical protein